MKHKVYLIDPVKKYIGIEDLDISDCVTSINRLIDASCFCLGWSFDNGDVIYVDDEGLLTPGKKSFHLSGTPCTLFGKGVVVGPEVNDKSTKPIMSYMDLINVVVYDPQYTTRG